MADLFSMKAPLMIRFPSGDKHIMAEYFRHPRGLLFFEVFWNQVGDSAIHLVEGEYKGDGPWKIGDCVINVLGCHGTDAELATMFYEWQTYRQMASDSYPSTSEIKELALSKGAVIESSNNK